jgi:hypothetical protein
MIRKSRNRFFHATNAKTRFAQILLKQSNTIMARTGCARIAPFQQFLMVQARKLTAIRTQFLPAQVKDSGWGGSLSMRR